MAEILHLYPSYDALNRLYQGVLGSTTNRLLYSGQQVVAAYNGSGALTNRYVPDLGLDRTLLWWPGPSTAINGASWLVSNAFGSVVAGGYSGTAAITTYDAFGIAGSSGLSPYNGNLGFKGMPSSGTSGIYYSRARTYNATLGRFLQTDPAGYVDGMNLYRFVHNSPVDGSDPTGLDGCDEQIASQNLGCLGEITVTSHPIFDTGGSTDVAIDSLPLPNATLPEIVVTASQNGNQAQSHNSIQNRLCEAGNSLANGSELLGDASGKLELIGLGAAGLGVVTAQPVLVATGLALAATGGVGNIGAGALQLGAGLLQGFGGGGYSNAGYAALSLVTGYTLARGITGPAVSGYRTVSQRSAYAFTSGAATVTGGVNDLLASLVDALAPKQVNCPGR